MISVGLGGDDGAAPSTIGLPCPNAMAADEEEEAVSFGLMLVVELIKRLVLDKLLSGAVHHHHRDDAHCSAAKQHAIRSGPVALIELQCNARSLTRP